MDRNNPISVIQSRLQGLRSARELAQAEIDSLELEKQAIQQIIPKVLHELSKKRNTIDHKQKEMNIFDKATSEIEQNYGHIIYSPDFFANEEASEN